MPPNVCTHPTVLCSIALFLFFLQALSALAQETPYSREISEFEDFVAQMMAADHTPAISIGFIKDDYSWARGFGFADLENKTAAKAESAYRLGSVTKPMTAVAVLQLVEKGKIDLDAEVQKYVPYFPKKKWPVTVRELLGHLGGISHYRDYNVEGHIKEQKTTREAIAIFENFDLVAEPGTKYSYSSYGYNLLGAVIEGASGQSYGEYVRQNVWEPAGMKDTRMDNPLDLIPNRVRGYQLIGGELKNSEAINISSRFAAGGTRSTVIDLLKFANALNEGKLISDKTRDLMYQSMVTRNGIFTDYGMGWDVEPVNGRFVVGHTGGQQETRTLLYNFPSRRFAIALALNYEGGDQSPYLVKLAELILHEPWRSAAYARERNQQISYQAIHTVFDRGLAYFDERQRELTSDPEELRKAFAFFSDLIATAPKNREKAIEKIESGWQQSTERHLTKVGSYMAARLQQKRGDGKALQYSGRGALPFFYDYISLYRSGTGIPKNFRFTKEFAKQIENWQRSWERTSTESVRSFDIVPSADPDDMREHFQSAFRGAAIYPDSMREFVRAFRLLILNHQDQKAVSFNKVAVNLYPASAQALATLGISEVITGDIAGGISSIKQSIAIDPKGDGSSESLNSFAYELSEIGRTREAIALLQATTEIHPTVANLFDSLGELQLKIGDRDAAIQAYKKALEIDPKLSSSQEALKKLMP